MAGTDRAYPFAESPARFTLVRRVLPKSETSDVLGTTPERLEISLEA